MEESVSFRNRFRGTREVHRFGAGLSSHALTLFLGTFNAMEFLPSLERQIASQSDMNFQIVIADNQSSDGTWGALLEMASRLEVPAIVVQNPVNVGFHGSLKLNEDLLESTWVAFMNQDDFYLPGHVATLNRLAQRADADTAILSAGLGSISSTGERLQTPPRATWQLGSAPTQLELMVATIAQHVLPEPSIAYRRIVLLSINSAWHSTAFPDTELVLNALTRGNALLSREETVLYRESPTSASHHLTADQRALGAALSLSRFLTGVALSDFEESLTTSQKNYLLEQVLYSLRSRFGSSKEFDYCALAFLEKRMVDSNYDYSLSLARAADIYFNRQSLRAATTLDAIVGAKRAIHNQGSNLGGQRSAESPNALAVALDVYQRWARFLPRQLNMLFGSLAMRMLSHLPRFASWKFRREPRR